MRLVSLREKRSQVWLSALHLGCARHISEHYPHLRPTGFSQPLPQSFLGAFPVRLGLLKLLLARRGESQQSLSPVFSRLYADPSTLDQQSEHARQARGVEREQLTQISLGDFTGKFQSHQQGELCQLKTGVPELVVVHLCDRSRRATKIGAGARQQGQGFVEARHDLYRCIYICSVVSSRIEHG
jgi:hypothetical protein